MIRNKHLTAIPKFTEVKVEARHSGHCKQLRPLEVESGGLDEVSAPALF